MTLETVNKPPPPSYSSSALSPRKETGTRPRDGPGANQPVDVRARRAHHRSKTEEEARRIHRELPTQTVHENPKDRDDYDSQDTHAPEQRSALPFHDSGTMGSSTHQQPTPD